MFAGNFAPLHWAFCDNQQLSIDQNKQLFDLLSNTYGGDGTTNFCLPGLRGRVPIHQGTGPGLSNRVLGQMLGSETVVLTTDQIPGHTHQLMGSSDEATSPSPEGNVPATGPTAPSLTRMYSDNNPGTSMSPKAIEDTGEDGAHTNMMPYQCVSFIIALEGTTPPEDAADAPTDSAAQPFVGEIRIFPYGFVPSSWQACNGQLLKITGNETLYSIIGITFGGDGKTTFGLPNLQTRAPLGSGEGAGLSYHSLGEIGGKPTVALQASELPAHSHQLMGDNGTAGAKSSNEPEGRSFGQGRFKDATDNNLYNSSPDNPASLQALGTVGQSAAHDNTQPYLGLQFCIAIAGEYPPRS